MLSTAQLLSEGQADHEWWGGGGGWILLNETLESRYDSFSSSGVDSNVFGVCFSRLPGKFSKTVFLVM